MTETRSNWLARHSLWLSVVLGVLFGLKLASHLSNRLERMQGGVTAPEAQRTAAWLPNHVVRVPLPVAGAPDGNTRVPFPEASTGTGARRVHDRLAVFVDEQRVPLVVGDADESVPLPRAVLRSRRAGAVLVQCPPSPACGDALLVWQDARFAVAMGVLRLARHPAATLALLLVCGLLIALLNARSWPSWATMPLALGGVAVTAAWFGTGVYATAWAPAILAAEAVLLVGAQVLPLSASERDDRRCARLLVPAPVRWMLAAAVALLLVNLEASPRWRWGPNDIALSWAMDIGMLCGAWEPSGAEGFSEAADRREWRSQHIALLGFPTVQTRRRRRFRRPTCLSIQAGHIHESAEVGNGASPRWIDAVPWDCFRLSRVHPSP